MDLITERSKGLTYRSVCAGWENGPIFSIFSSLSYVLDAKNTLVEYVGPFLSTLILTVSTLNRLWVGGWLDGMVVIS